MKIVLLNANYNAPVIGGGQRSVQYLAEELVRQGHQAVAISTVPHRGITTGMLNGVRTYQVGLWNVYWPFGTSSARTWAKAIWHTIDAYNLPMSRRIGSILDLERPDVVHTNVMAGFSIGVWREAKKRRLPVVHTLRDYYLLCVRSSMRRRDRNCESQCTSCRLYSAHKKAATVWVDAVIGNSDFILQSHLRRGLFNRTPIRRVIHNGYVVRGPGREVPIRNGTRPLHLGYLGRLHPSKGIEHLLTALRSFNRSEYELLVAGKGTPEYEKRLTTYCHECNVRFLGFTEPERFFGMIDVLVVPSLWHEPLPRTVFEAYANGIPVIGSNRGGIPEIIDVGKTGLLFDPDQPNSLRDAVSALLQSPDLVFRMRSEASKKSLEFLPERIAREYLAVYSEVVSRSAR